MPILFLGIFDTVYNWVYAKIITPIMKFVENIFNTIINTIFRPIFEPIITALWNYIISYIADIIFARVYAEYVGLLEIVNTLQGAFDVLIGIEDITYTTQVGGEAVKNSDTLLNYIVFSDGVGGAIKYITAGAIVLTFVFTIYSVIRSVLDFDFENKRPVGKILGTMLKTMITFAIVPLLVWAGLNLSSALLRTTVYALGDDGTTSIADNILLVSSLDAGITENDITQTYNPQYKAQLEKYNNQTDNSVAKPASDPWNEMLYNNMSYIEFGTNIHVSMVDYLVGFSSTIFCIFIMLACLFLFIRRIYDVALLYIVSPYFTATMVLDDGQKFAQWREMFIGKVLSGFGAAISMRLYLMMVPIIMSENIQFFDGGGFVGSAGDYVLKLIFLLGGMYAIYKSSSLLTQIISSGAARDEQADMAVFTGVLTKIKDKMADETKRAKEKYKNENYMKQFYGGTKFDRALDTDKRSNAFDGGQGFTGGFGAPMGMGYGYFPPAYGPAFAGNGMPQYPSLGDDQPKNDDKPNDDLPDGQMDASNESYDMDDGGIKPETERSVEGPQSEPNNDFSGAGSESNGSFNGFDRELAEYKSCTGGIGMINVGGGSYAMPFGYTAFPRIVPRSQAAQQIEKMRSNKVPGLDAGFYDSVEQHVEQGGSISYDDGISGDKAAFTSYGGLNADVGSDYVVIPEIMRTDIAYDTAIEYAHSNDSNSGFYSNYAEHMAMSGYSDMPEVFNYADRSAVPTPISVREADPNAVTMSAVPDSIGSMQSSASQYTDTFRATVTSSSSVSANAPVSAAHSVSVGANAFGADASSAAKAPEAGSRKPDLNSEPKKNRSDQHFTDNNN